MFQRVMEAEVGIEPASTALQAVCLFLLIRHLIDFVYPKKRDFRRFRSKSYRSVYPRGRDQGEPCFLTALGASDDGDEEEMRVSGAAVAQSWNQ